MLLNKYIILLIFINLIIHFKHNFYQFNIFVLLLKKNSFF